MPLAHPTKAMLGAYARGEASSGVSLLVAAHLTFCPACRAHVAARESLSGALLGETAPEAMSEAALGATLARLDFAANDNAPPPAESDAGEVAPTDPPLPRPVAALLGPEGLRWRFRMPGVAEIALPSDGAEQVSLLRVRPGAGAPAHTHDSDEATLVLSGEMIDRGVVYGPGDMAVAGPEDDHRPRAGLGADCVCLTVLSGRLRFTGRFGRALNLLAE